MVGIPKKLISQANVAKLLQRHSSAPRYYSSSCFVCKFGTESNGFNGYSSAVPYIANNIMPINGESDLQSTVGKANHMLSVNTARPTTQDTNTNNTHTSQVLSPNHILQQLQPQDSYAIFIDAQNVSSTKHNELALQHLKSSIPSHSLPSIQLIYGDVHNLSKCSQFILDNGLRIPYRYPDAANPKLHNIDVLMVMDIIETLYTKPHIKAYVLFTGDGDFSPLVHKLREAGKIVVVYGRKKSTSPALQSACHCYFNIEVLLAAEEASIQNEKRLKKEEGKKLAKKLAIEEQRKKMMQEEKQKAQEEKKLKEKQQKADEKLKRLKEEERRQRLQSISSFFSDLFTNPLKVSGGTSATLSATPTLTMAADKKLAATNNKNKIASTSSKIPEPAKDEIFQLVKEHAKKGWTNISHLADLIDYKKMGYKRISLLLDDMPEIEFHPSYRFNVRLRNNTEAPIRESDKDDIIRLVIEHMDEDGWTKTDKLGSQVSHKMLGYKKLSHLLQVIPEIEGKGKSYVWVRLRDPF